MLQKRLRKNIKLVNYIIKSIDRYLQLALSSAIYLFWVLFHFQPNSIRYSIFRLFIEIRITCQTGYFPMPVLEWKPKNRSRSITLNGGHSSSKNCTTINVCFALICFGNFMIIPYTYDGIALFVLPPGRCSAMWSHTVIILISLPIYAVE